MTNSHKELKRNKFDLN
uniref:Uncharacterized protein n=1 Tax=Rhizophora mucronata TaxID=61149 RepID=A0A2P2NBT2_RHIMU